MSCNNLFPPLVILTLPFQRGQNFHFACCAENRKYSNYWSTKIKNPSRASRCGFVLWYSSPPLPENSFHDLKKTTTSKYLNTHPNIRTACDPWVMEISSREESGRRDIEVLLTQDTPSVVKTFRRELFKYMCF